MSDAVDSPASGDGELIDSIERVTAASRRTWPLMLLGLLAIVAGFALLAVVIQQLRDEAADQRRSWTAAAARLEATLQRARTALDRRNPERAKAWIDEAIRQARELQGIPQAPDVGEVPDDPAPVENRPSPAPPPTTNTLPEANTPEPAPEPEPPPPPPQPSLLVTRAHDPVWCGRPEDMADLERLRRTRPLRPGREYTYGPGSYACRLDGAPNIEPFNIGLQDPPARFTITLRNDALVITREPLP